MGIVGLNLVLLVLAVYGSIYCPGQGWVSVAGWLTGLIWVLVMVLAIRYRRRVRSGP